MTKNVSTEMWDRSSKNNCSFRSVQGQTFFILIHFWFNKQLFSSGFRSRSNNLSTRVELKGKVEQNSFHLQ